MFCQKCGNEIQDNSKFCPNCGAAVDPSNKFRPIKVNDTQNAGSTHYNSRYEVRQAELREVDNMINYFSQKAAAYDEIAMVTGRLNVLERKLNKTPTAGIVLASLCGAFAVLSLMIGAGHGPWGITAFVAFATGIPGFIILSVYFISRAINKPKYKKYCKRFDELNEELTQYYNNYGYCPVGIEYTNPTDLQAIRNTIQSGYADTSKEAVNYLMQKYHNEVMESNLAATKRAANATAVISAAHFFFR